MLEDGSVSRDKDDLQMRNVREEVHREEEKDRESDEENEGAKDKFRVR